MGFVAEKVAIFVQNDWGFGLYLSSGLKELENVSENGSVSVFRPGQVKKTPVLLGPSERGKLNPVNQVSSI